MHVLKMGRGGWIEPVTITKTGQITVPCFELPPKTDKLFKIDIRYVGLRRGKLFLF